ncbi:hypothetical protein FRC08_008627 [Ceratobasidium sp. 394]|nr:hypothetical protein FRC08_008627 [Ceratobasidium sp. 394]
MLQVCLEDSTQGSEIPSFCPLHTLEFSGGSSIVYMPNQLEPTRRFLMALFPDLRKVVWPKDKNNKSPSFMAQQRFIGFLNRHMALKRELEELKVMSKL